MSKSFADKVAEWALGREEFAGSTVERNVELRGQKKGVTYTAELVVRRRSKLSALFRGWLFNSGPLSGSAAAITLRRDSSPVSVQDVIAAQRRAMDVMQAVVKGKEGCPVSLWLYISAAPFTAEARKAAGQLRYTWFGYMNAEGVVEQVL